MQRYLERTAYESLMEWKNRKGRSTLEVSGARQVGKTYIVNKFADEQYKHKIYINLLDFSGELFLEKYEELKEEIKRGLSCDNPVYELIRRTYPQFLDSPDTVVIIDEIQESAAVYNRLREFTRQLKSDFIITGSYLGRILNREFKYSAGDLESLEINTLSFEEFLTSIGKYREYEELELFGNGRPEIYEELSALYQIYTKIGGYPAVVLRYLESGSVEEANVELLKIIKLFTNESRRYFEDILDDTVYDNIFSSVARVLVKEKKGFEKDSFSEELQSIVVKDYSSNISKASVNRAIDWLYSSGIIGFAGKIKDCNILEFKPKSRCYFMDVGLTSYFLTHIGCAESDIAGIVSENFVFLDLKRRIVPPGEIALETPAFATLGNGEIDFYLKSLATHKTYAIEVKAGKKNSRTVQMILEKKKADYVVLAKGNTQGGKKDNVYTIPIYGIGKFRF